MYVRACASTWCRLTHWAVQQLCEKGNPCFKILSLRHRGVKTPHTSGSALERTDQGTEVIPSWTLSSRCWGKAAHHLSIFRSQRDRYWKHRMAALSPWPLNFRKRQNDPFPNQFRNWFWRTPWNPNTGPTRLKPLVQGTANSPGWHVGVEKEEKMPTIFLRQLGAMSPLPLWFLLVCFSFSFCLQTSSNASHYDKPLAHIFSLSFAFNSCGCHWNPCPTDANPKLRNIEELSKTHPAVSERDRA